MHFSYHIKFLSNFQTILFVILCTLSILRHMTYNNPKIFIENDPILDRGEEAFHEIRIRK